MAGSNPSSASNKSPPSLQLEEDPRFQRRQWVAERIAWVVMPAIILATLAGLFGGAGPLSNSIVASSDGRSRIEYQSFARRASPTTLEIAVNQTAGERLVRVRIDQRYLRDMSLRSITPHPSATSLGDGSHTFSFNQSPGSFETKIQLQFEPDAIGSVEGQVVIDDGAPLRITHFIFP